VNIENTSFWDMIQCSSVETHQYGGTYCFLLQGLNFLLVPRLRIESEDRNGTFLRKICAL
jgi:hypothetical protein